MSPSEPPVTVVTSADRDEGAAVARALASDRSVVVLCGRDADALGSLQRELPGRVAIFLGDPAIEPDAAALREMVAELFNH